MSFTERFGRIILYFLLVVVLSASALLMRASSFGEAAIMDELAHIPAGYSYVKFGDHRLNPEHPPLLKVLAGLPLLGLDLQFPTAHKSWTEDVNGQWIAGDLFLYHSGNNPDDIVQTARLGAIFLTLLTILVIYLWGVELIGRWWALLPATLFAASPSVLAHGHFVTTDIAATFGVCLSTYLFVRWLQRPTRGRLIGAGIGFGIAQLAKFSLVLLVPLFVFLLVAFLIAAYYRRRTTPNPEPVLPSLRAWKRFAGLCVIFCVGYVLVFAAYVPLVWNYPHARQISDATFILKDYNPPITRDIIMMVVQNPTTRAFGEYLLGFFMVLQRAAGGNTGYFLGDVSNFGWWYYFPTVFALKEPIPSLLLLVIGIGIALQGVIRSFATSLRFIGKKFVEYVGTNTHEFAMILFVILYWAYSMASPLNIGFRHILPTLPLFYLLMAGALRRWVSGGCTTPTTDPTSASQKMGRCKTIKYSFVFLLLILSFVETARSFPYYMSYFNQIGGGVSEGYRFVTDSNYDWGQDLRRLATIVKERNIQKIAIDYFGGGSPEYYLGTDVVERWSSWKGNPKEKGIGWFAVSVNNLQGSLGTLGGTVKRNPEDEYPWLTESRPSLEGMGQVPEPDARAGTSLFLYRL